MDPEEINEACKNFFWRIRVSEKLEGDDDGKIRYGGKRFNLMGADYFMSEIIEDLSDLYAGAAGGIIRETGQEYGRELLETVDEGQGDERFGNFLAFLQFIGYSGITAEKERLRVYSSPTAEEHLKADYKDKKVCFFLSGILAGAYRDIYGEKVEFVEEQCKAEGADACVFTKQSSVAAEEQEE
jgi:predicted hydrocarbon binding protein